MLFKGYSNKNKQEEIIEDRFLNAKQESMVNQEIHNSGIIK